MTAVAPFRRKLPGHAARSGIYEEIVFHRGVVIHSGWGMTGPVTQTIQTESKYWCPLVKLIGDTYAYWCRNCQITVWEQELIMRARAGRDSDGEYSRSPRANEQKCPFCYKLIVPLQPGDKVRVHYRFAENGS